jgi:DNA-binding response OmpR family regulator
VVLAALAADAGRLVTHETLIERVWGSAPPLRAARTMHTHVANLRQEAWVVRSARSEDQIIYGRPNSQVPFPSNRGVEWSVER